METEIRDLLSQLEVKDRIISEHKDSRKALEQVSDHAELSLRLNP